MKKIITTIKNWVAHAKVWWQLHFRNTLVREVEFDAYKVVFRQYTMEITTKSGNLKLRTTGMLYPNAFLFNAVEKGDEKVLEWFCNELYQFVCLITKDSGLIQDVNKAFAKYYKRMEKKAESLAKEITEDDDKLALEQLKFNQEYAKKSKKERKEYQEALREELRKEEE